MSRLQLALNVSDIDEGVDFYSRLFGVTPHKRRPGYANFEVADPPLKLVLFESEDGSERLNHLGVEVPSADEVSRTATRLRNKGLDPDVQDATTCCFATQDKAWVSDPDGGRWEVYAITDDDPDGLGLRSEDHLSEQHSSEESAGDSGCACS